MSNIQRNLFQKKLKIAESALGFDFSEEAEEGQPTNPQPALPKSKEKHIDRNE